MVRVEAQGRLLTLHSAVGYQERGASATVSVGEGARRSGLLLSLATRWGAGATGADALWQDHVHRYASDEGRGELAIDARVDYGVRLRDRLLLTPFVVYGQSRYGRRLHIGGRIDGLVGARSATKR